MNKTRLTITLDPKVYALIKNTKANKSQYIEDLIARDFQDKKRETIKEAILTDQEYLSKLKNALSLANARSEPAELNYTNDWGA